MCNEFVCERCYFIIFQQINLIKNEGTSIACMLCNHDEGLVLKLGGSKEFNRWVHPVCVLLSKHLKFREDEAAGNLKMS